jgi:hypothetical protein
LPGHDSAPPRDLLPPINQSFAFAERWKRERAITVGKIVPSPLTAFLPPNAQVPSFVVMNYKPDGSEWPEGSRTRYDTTHPNCPKDKDDGKPVKYRLDGSPGSSVVIAPLPDSHTTFAKANKKWIAEGEGKVLALAGLGLPALGIGGCYGWNVTETRQLLPDLANSIHRGDTVYVAFDGDVRRNPTVRRAADDILVALAQLGAIPYFVLLPETEDAKLGIDDLIARWKRDALDPLAELDKLPRHSSLSFLDDFELTSYDALLARPFPEWIVEGLVQPGELTAIVGATSCGKSFLVQDLLLAVARHLPTWFAFDINRSGLVVHVTMEGKGLDNRTKAYRQHHKLTGSVPYLALERSVSLLVPQEVDRLIRTIKNAALRLSLPVALIAIDTVNRALAGGDENGSDMGLLIRSADRIRDGFPDAGVLLIHHFGKDERRGPRGHSSFGANIGAQLDIENNAGARTVTVTKQRDGEAGKRFAFRLEPVELGKNSKGKPITSCVVVPSAVSASAKDAEPDYEAIYRMIYAFWVAEYGSKPTTPNAMRDRTALIVKGATIPKPKGVKMKDVIANAFLWAIDRGFAKQEGKVSGHPSYGLTLPPPKKY